MREGCIYPAGLFLPSHSANLCARDPVTVPLINPLLNPSIRPPDVGLSSGGVLENASLADWGWIIVPKKGQKKALKVPSGEKVKKRYSTYCHFENIGTDLNFNSGRVAVAAIKLPLSIFLKIVSSNANHD